jgi:hypothetical protein
MQYVATYEHRVVANTVAPQVHHRNHVKDDNRPENLLGVTPAEHGSEHVTWDRQLGKELYESGLTCQQIAERFGITSGQVSRGLRNVGTVMRPASARGRAA